MERKNKLIFIIPIAVATYVISAVIYYFAHV